MQQAFALKSTTSFLILVIFRGEQRKQHYSYKRERSELAQRNKNAEMATRWVRDS